jgi:MerR family transcriptional regulator, light-induced transcriptional regulator
MHSTKPADHPSALQQPGPTFRSGTVARMAGMPVATLRIWEQRYQAVRPTTAASGHRLYSQADVERVTLLRRLTEQGFAIGSLATLDSESMRDMLSTQLAANQIQGETAQALPSVMRVVVVGQALAQRLQRMASRQLQNVVLETVAVFDTLADAAEATQSSSGQAVDLLLWQTSGLQLDSAHELRAAREAWRKPVSAVVYRYGNAAARAELRTSGVLALKEPADDEALGRWLASLQDNPLLADTHPARRPVSRHVWTNLLDQKVSAPRFAEAGLAEFAALPSAVACECPSHLAQLLLQVTSFEAYSSACANRNVADARLHAYLQQVAGTVRMLFESALERVATAEGLPLPHDLQRPTSFASPNQARSLLGPAPESPL